MTSQKTPNGLKLPRGKLMLKRRADDGKSYILVRNGSLFPRLRQAYVFECDQPLKANCDGKQQAGLRGTLYTLDRPIRMTQVDLLITTEYDCYSMVVVRHQGWFTRVFDPSL